MAKLEQELSKTTFGEGQQDRSDHLSKMGLLISLLSSLKDRSVATEKRLQNEITLVE
jgi:hypothetical protein